MPLAFSADASPADWIVGAAIPWRQLVSFGPSGFPAYARLRFLPDPAYEGQSENDVDVPDELFDGIDDQWSVLFELLAAHTQTPDDCFFCLWDGWPLDYPVRQLATTFTIVGKWFSGRTPVRSYYLFRGPLSEIGAWGDGFSRRDDPWEPAFVWPADRAWCVAKDVDPHYAGIGAQGAVIERLIGDPRLDAVAADPAQGQPHYQ